MEKWMFPGCAEVQLEKQKLTSKLARDVKNHKQAFFRYINSKQKQKEDTGLLLNRRDESLTNSSEKVEVLNSFSTSTAGPQVSGTKMQAGANTGLLSVKAESMCELLLELDPYDSMGSDDIAPRGQGSWIMSL